VTVGEGHPVGRGPLSEVPGVLLYLIDDYHSVSQVFVRREVDMLRTAGACVKVFSLHSSRRRSVDWHLAPASHRALGRAACDVLLCPRGRRALVEAVKITRGGTWRRSLGQLYALLVAAHVRRATGSPPAHIHAHFFGRCADVARYLSRLTERPFSATGHATEVLAPRDTRVLCRNVSSAAGLVAESDLVLARLTLLDGYSGKPTITIRSGLPRELLRRSARSPRARPPGPRESIRLLTTARLTPKKGLFTLLDAATLLRSRGVPYHWQIIGEGPLRAALERRLSSNDLSSSVRLLGARTNTECLAHLRLAHVFVLPCVELPDGETDGLPAALIEAVGLGTPVITTAVGAIPELIVHEQTGLLIPEHNPTALVEAITRLRDERQLYDTIVTTGRRLARSEYVLENEVQHLREFFADCISYARSR